MPVTHLAALLLRGVGRWAADAAAAARAAEGMGACMLLSCTLQLSGCAWPPGIPFRRILPAVPLPLPLVRMRVQHAGRRGGVKRQRLARRDAA